MKRYFKHIVIAIALLFTVMWENRYISINQYYKNIDKSSTTYYTMDQEVAFGTDFIEWQEPANGYFLKIEKFEIVNTDDYLLSIPYDVDMENEPQSEKLALITVTLRNENNADDAVFLTDFLLHGTDTVEPMSWTIFQAINPDMEGFFGVKLHPQSDAQFVLPYYIQRSRFSRGTWNNLKDYQFFLRVTAFPTKKNIMLELDTFC